jgi:arginine N-succinyltransferase
MAEHPELFDPVVIAEMRGIIDENGRSSFWEAVGRHFFDVDFPTADYLSVVDKRFIAELMPVHPIYLPLLPPQAQQVVGKVHPRTEPAMKMLLDEGFELANMVDIFDAGPTVTCPMTRVRSVRESEEARVVALTDEEPGEPDESGKPAYIIACMASGFRACVGGLDRPRAEGVRMSRRVADAIEASPGDRVRFVTLRPGA